MQKNLSSPRNKVGMLFEPRCKDWQYNVKILAGWGRYLRWEGGEGGVTAPRGKLFAVFSLEKPVPFGFPSEARLTSLPSPGACLLVAATPGSSPRLCADHLGARSELSWYLSLLGAPHANLIEAFSHSMALASNYLSCFLPSVRALSALPGRDSNLNERAHTEPSPFS